MVNRSEKNKKVKAPLIMFFILTILCLSGCGAKVEVHNDISEYNEYIHNSSEEVSSRCRGEMYEIFPAAITKDMEVEEFQHMYYNPWDAQYITYMKVSYGKEAYEDEIARLQDIGQGAYQGRYSVTGEPQGYDLMAIYADEYLGFVYAMIPEDAAEDTTEIIYVGIDFCNYFLDVNVEDYLPDEYLLEGFDATIDNPYRKSQMRK